VCMLNVLTGVALPCQVVREEIYSHHRTHLLITLSCRWLHQKELQAIQKDSAGQSKGHSLVVEGHHSHVLGGAHEVFRHEHTLQAHHRAQSTACALGLKHLHSSLGADFVGCTCCSQCPCLAVTFWRNPHDGAGMESKRLSSLSKHS
jgi:hypothetical protein